MTVRRWANVLTGRAEVHRGDLLDEPEETLGCLRCCGEEQQIHEKYACIDEKYALKRSTNEEAVVLVGHRMYCCCDSCLVMLMSPPVIAIKNVIALEEAFMWSNQVLARLECMEGGSFRSYLRALGQVMGLCSDDGQRRYALEEALCVARYYDDHVAGIFVMITKDVVRYVIAQAFKTSIEELLDFDVAAEIPRSGRLTEVIGTVENMAPEVFQGAYGELADIWSVGVITYEALYGYRPFNDANIDRVEEMVRNWQRYLLFPFDATELPAAKLLAVVGANELHPPYACRSSGRALVRGIVLVRALFEATDGFDLQDSKFASVHSPRYEDPADNIEAETTVGWEERDKAKFVDVESECLGPEKPEKATGPLRNGRFIPVSAEAAQAATARKQSDSPKKPAESRRPRPKEQGAPAAEPSERERAGEKSAEVLAKRSMFLVRS
ncbi:Citron Rho-interacting kinase [Symbiodinium microadriaticum]|uniref:Citron Rho-interacting kinase n=1 Tax=Symbiodinium microadriaticum TaxID=2951 RepID=A0A1Q9DJQ6_SYMMI|nr:Citron Rho-interacting kinase [Symbiodinium microadriaticum]